MLSAGDHIGLNAQETDCLFPLGVIYSPPKEGPGLVILHSRVSEQAFSLMLCGHMFDNGRGIDNPYRQVSAAERERLTASSQ
jgi:hypothetical protein